jgi:hypothetical protein
MATYPPIIDILFCTAAVSGAILSPPMNAIRVHHFISGVLSMVVVLGVELLIAAELMACHLATSGGICVAIKIILKTGREFILMVFL